MSSLIREMSDGENGCLLTREKRRNGTPSDTENHFKKTNWELLILHLWPSLLYPPLQRNAKIKATSLYHLSPSVCVCVQSREREREREMASTTWASSMLLCCYCIVLSAVVCEAKVPELLVETYFLKSWQVSDHLQVRGGTHTLTHFQTYTHTHTPSPTHTHTPTPTHTHKHINSRNRALAHHRNK